MTGSLLRMFTCGLAMLLAMPASTIPAAAAQAADGAPTAAQRLEFAAAGVALAAGRNEEFQRLRRRLDGYVLAPYLDHAALRRSLRTLDPERAGAFLERESGTQLAVQFRREWLAELARRGDWRHLRTFDDTGDDSTSVRCHRLRADIADGGRDESVRERMLELWSTGRSLPDACDEAIAYARGRGWIGTEQIHQRLRLALDEGNAGLAAHLARQLPAGQRGDGERLVRAINDPEGLLSAARNWADNVTTREAIARALQRRARQNVDAAIDHWQALSRRFDFVGEQRTAIVRELALYAAVAYRDDSRDWFARVPDEARDEQLHEWQLRAALVAGDWTGVRDVAEHLLVATPDAQRPRYWRARALHALGHTQQAQGIFEGLATEATFHGFLAADRLGLPYALCPLEVVANAGHGAELRRRVDIARALELHAVGRRADATRAWNHALADASREDRLQAVHLATTQGWYDRAVFSLTSGDDLRYYDLRFPVAERATVERETTVNALDPAWVKALIRAESAWQPDARSHADAWGLMQLLPATGQRMARDLGLAWNGTSTLLDPTTNIRLGTRYLARQTERFDGSPWLASAAYNAGPNPVQRWLAARPTLPADVFIETIPYRETREYVARVLAFSVIYDWRLYGKARPLSSRLPDPGQRYAGVPSLEHARPVACPGSLHGRNVRGEKPAARGRMFGGSPPRGGFHGARSGGHTDRADGFAARTASAAQAPWPGIARSPS